MPHLLPAKPVPLASRLSRKVLDSALWSVVVRALTMGVHAVAFVWLARLLTPAEYGRYTLAIVVVGLLSVVAQLGVRSALVQRRHLTRRHISSAFWFTIALGTLGTVSLQLFALAAGPADWAEVLFWCAGNLWLLNAAAVPLALLQRRLRFRDLLAIELVASAVGSAGVSIAAALAGWGVWSLVLGGLVRDGLVVTGGLVRCRTAVWGPPRWTLLGGLLRFGGPLTVIHGFNELARQGDFFLVGRLLGAQALGYYSRAFYLVNRLNLLVVNGLHPVLFAAFAKAAGQPLRLRNGYLRATRVLATVTLPMFTGVALAADDLVGWVLGEPWMRLVPVLRWCCVIGAFPSLASITDALLKATGNLRPQLYRHAAHAVLVLLGAGLGSLAGLVGVAIGVALAWCAMYVSMTALALRMLGISWRSYAATLLPGLSLASLVLVAKTGVEAVPAVGTSALLRIGLFVAVAGAGATVLPFVLPKRVIRALQLEWGLLREAIAGQRRGRDTPGADLPARNRAA